MESILDIQEKYKIDDSVTSFETYAYQPISGTQLNSSGQIVIRIENQDAFFYPRRSWLQFEGTLTKKGQVGAAAIYPDADLITFVNNGILFLFDNIKYDLGGQEIESLYYPGQATTMLGLAKYSSNFNVGPGLNQCWRLDEGDGKAVVTNTGFDTRHKYFVKESTPKGSFRIAVDLEHIFGFCEDYDHVMYGHIHTLTLVRNADSNNALFKATRNAPIGDGEITITKLSWMMPKVVPSDGEKYKLYKTIESKAILDVAFRMRQCTTISIPTTPTYTWRLGIRSAPEKPRYIMVGFQTDKINKQDKNTGLFDHCKLKNIYILLNNVRYPAIDFSVDFAKHHYENLYKAFCDFARKYYGVDWLITSTAVDPISYMNFFPIFIFDVSKQSERLQAGIVDITIEMFFGENVGAGTLAYALLISDRKLKFQSDGKKMTVIY